MDTSFPFMEETSDTAIEQVEGLPLFQEYAWDYEQNDFVLRDGQPVILAGNEALKVWVYKVLKTKRYRYPAYSSEYGSEFETLIGSAYTPAIQRSEAERFIREALLVNPYISDIEPPDIQLIGDELRIHVVVNTIYGEVTVDV
ncbi:DUF2634 domain-containing protein [Paenibacillus agilis]|nr:DUF2634 domain-containing protein [Paenibacillus agilis]